MSSQEATARVGSSLVSVVGDLLMTAGVGGVVAEDLVAEGRFDADRVALEGLPPDEALGAPVAIAGWREGHREDAFIIGRQLLVLALAAVMEVGRRLAVAFDAPDQQRLGAGALDRQRVTAIAGTAQRGRRHLDTDPAAGVAQSVARVVGRAGALEHRRRRKGRRPSGGHVEQREAAVREEQRTDGDRDPDARSHLVKPTGLADQWRDGGPECGAGQLECRGGSECAGGKCAATDPTTAKTAWIDVLVLV